LASLASFTVAGAFPEETGAWAATEIVISNTSAMTVISRYIEDKKRSFM